jgi:hypothetical protein
LLQTAGLTAVLEDVYLNTKTPLSVSGSTNYDFNIINHPDSYNPFRFRIVFKALSTLPVSFTAITATRQNDDIKVAWKVANEINIAHYEVEKSADGRNFNSIATVAALGNSGNSILNYQLLDKNVFEGYNFYRIKSIGIAGEISFSNVVKVAGLNCQPAISIYPNPVKDGLINLQMNNATAGLYYAKIYNSSNQLIFSKQIQHTGSGSVVTLKANQFLLPGNYYAEITSPNHSSIILKFVNQ